MDDYEKIVMRDLRNDLKEAREKIANLEQQLTALSWQKIGPENLPKVEKVVISRLKSNGKFFSVNYTWRDWKKDDLDPLLDQWIISAPQEQEDKSRGHS